MYLIIYSAFVLAAFLNVPMLIHLNTSTDSSPLSFGINHKLKYYSVFCGLLLIASFSLKLKWPMLPYLALLLYLSLFGVRRLLKIGIYRLEEFFISLAFMNLAVAFVWLAATLLGTSFLGFDEPWISLTSIHFHYTACFSLCIFGLLGRTITNNKTRRVWKYSTLTIAISIWGLAMGITFSPALELVSALILSLGFISNSLLLIRLRSIFFKLAGIVNIVAMVFAMGYALDNFGIINVSLDILTMLKSHGLLNAFFFVPLALVGFIKLKTMPLMNSSAPPLSLLKTNTTVDRDIVRNMNWERKNSNEKCTGILDNINELESDLFKADQTDERIKDFYLNTDKWDMTIDSEWGLGFSLTSKVWSIFSKIIGQMNFPNGQEELETQIIPIESELDGRSNVRAWVRNYKGSKKTIYAAFYSTHESFGSRYMNIAFPFQVGNLTSILRFIGMGKKEIDVSTISSDNKSGDEGIYFVSGDFFIRLPMNESIKVFVPEDETDCDLRANHRVWIFGIKLLDLKYSLSIAIT